MMTEQEMRDTEVPTFDTAEELTEYIGSLVSQEHDYGTCVYAMSMAAVAAFNYVARNLGVTGFQASCADLDILRRTRRMDRFMILNFQDALYPQYSLQERLAKGLSDAKPWLAEEANKLLAESAEGAHPDVVAHWRGLSAN